MATGVKTLEAVGVTVVGVGVGALIGGPVGAGIGLAAGAIIDIILLRHRRTPFGAPQGMPGQGVPGFVPGVVQQAMVPGAQSLPPGADVAAASKLTALLLLAAGGSNARLQLDNSGPSKFVGPATGWLKQFQASVGVPATGQLDAPTRALLVLATASGPYDASKLPATTILG
jgi:hypothetical protein